MVPHSAMEASKPSAIKPKPTADKIALAIPMDDWTIIGDNILGKICLQIIRISLAPEGSLASMYSCSLTEITPERIIRAKTGIREIPMAIVKVLKLDP